MTPRLAHPGDCLLYNHHLDAVGLRVISLHAGHGAYATSVVWVYPYATLSSVSAVLFVLREAVGELPQCGP